MIVIIIPSRFVSGIDATPPLLGHAMDVFSAGCVVLEVFAETAPFSLQELLAYRNGTHFPKHHLAKIGDAAMRVRKDRRC